MTFKVLPWALNPHPRAHFWRDLFPVTVLKRETAYSVDEFEPPLGNGRESREVLLGESIRQKGESVGQVAREDGSKMTSIGNL